MKIITIYNEVLEYKVQWIISDNKKEVTDFFKNKGFLPEKLDISEGYTYIDGCNSYMYLTNRSDYVLLHELIHIVQHILHEKDISTGFENTEILAYNVDYLYRKCIEKYNKYKKTIKK